MAVKNILYVPTIFFFPFWKDCPCGLLEPIVSVFDEQGKKNKKFFWVPAIAPLISVILATFFVYITRADKRGVQIVSFGIVIL